ncbi:hypothetical protein Tco_1401238 [Tanacetum coccineum]
MRNRIFMHTMCDDNVLGTLRFISKSDEYQVYGALLPEGMANQQMRDSPAYKTYIAFATGAATPKKARKFKKPTSPSKKKTLMLLKNLQRNLPRNLLLEDSPLGFKFETLLMSQLKKDIKRRKRETRIHQAGGSSERADLELKVPDEPKGKTIDISEGTGLKPRVPDVSKADSSENSDDDDQQSDDERTEFNDDDKAVDINKTDDEEDDEFVHTPNDYVPIDDENVDDEKFKRINKEMYSDVNVELKDLEHESEGKDDEEMTDAGQVDAEHEKASQEVAGETKIISMMDIKVQHEDTSIQTSPLLTAPVIVIPETLSAPSNCSRIDHLELGLIWNDNEEKPYGLKRSPHTPTTTEAITSATAATDSTTLTAIHQRLFDVENEVKTLRNINHSLAIRAVVKSEVLIIVKEYIGTSLDDALHKIKMEQAGKQQEPKYTIHKALNHALMESILEDKDAMDKGVADKLKKRKPDDDRDEGPSARPDQGLKRKKTGKETKPSKKAKSTGTSKGTTKSQSKSTGKSTQAEETVFKAGDT